MGGIGSGVGRIATGPKPRSLHDKALTNLRVRLPDGVELFPDRQPLAPDRPVRDWRPSTAQRSKLRKRGRAYLTERLRHYAYTPAEGDILLQACRALDEAALWQRRSHSWKQPADAVRAGRLQILFEREFANAIALLRERR